MLVVVDGIVLVAAFALPAVAVWRRWPMPWLVSLGSVWVGLYLWGHLLSALDDQRTGFADSLWLITGWAVALIWVVLMTAVRDRAAR